MNRLLFEKTGKAIYISHLDTMAMFPRIFLRAGLQIKFTQGMSPHAYVSMALPLSVGMSSQCELLDFTLEEEGVALETLPERLNPYFPAGIRVLEAYDSSEKVKNLRYLHVNTRLEYDNGASDQCLEAIRGLFDRETILIEKKTKKGMAETDIRPMISSMGVSRISPQELELSAVVCAQNPSLNPQYLVKAIERYLPEYTPDFSKAHRLEIYDENMRVFR
ncbi:MAG: TIGR03936 family radical SAM-associated protein [Oscillospiraceae bacterium]|nr:TIGR03936 family radical SAM-associated protein [Oscillospiraceae bacterium]